MSFDQDDKFGFKFPAQHGGATPAGLRRSVMENAGVGGFNTRIITLPDGSTSIYKSKGGNPEFVVIPADTTPDNCPMTPDHGLVLDGHKDGASSAYAGGEINGHGYLVEGKNRYAIVAGNESWLYGEHLGANSWLYIDPKGGCWVASVTGITSELNAMTLTLSKNLGPGIERTVAQMVTLSTDSVLFPTTTYSDGSNWTWARYWGLEDVCTNGKKATISSSIFPSTLNVNRPSKRYENHFQHMGRYLLGAKEILITGVPPAATVTTTTVLDSNSAVGTLTSTSVGGGNGVVYSTTNTYENVAVGIRYKNVTRELVAAKFTETYSAKTTWYSVGPNLTRYDTEDIFWEYTLEVDSLVCHSKIYPGDSWETKLTDTGAHVSGGSLSTPSGIVSEYSGVNSYSGFSYTGSGISNASTYGLGYPAINIPVRSNLDAEGSDILISIFPVRYSNGVYGIQTVKFSLSGNVITGRTSGVVAFSDNGLLSQPAPFKYTCAYGYDPTGTAVPPFSEYSAIVPINASLNRKTNTLSVAAAILGKVAWV